MSLKQNSKCHRLDGLDVATLEWFSRVFSVHQSSLGQNSLHPLASLHYGAHCPLKATCRTYPMSPSGNRFLHHRWPHAKHNFPLSSTSFHV